MDDNTSPPDTPIKRKFWAPIQNVLDFLGEYLTKHQCVKILEIGPGPRPFKYATHFIEHEARFMTHDNITNIDVEFDTFPFPDKYFDFVYCRHVLEDLDNPFHCISEMQRTSKAGYIETPNPIAESSRHVSDEHRGYIHHRWFVAADATKLYFFSKYPMFEYSTNESLNERFYALLLNPFNWNTYYFWENEILFYKYKPMIDFDFTGKTMSEVLSKMLNLGQQNANEFISKNLHFDIRQEFMAETK